MATGDYKAIPDPLADVHSLREALLAAKETIEVLTRQRKPIAAAAVTWQDLVDLGFLRVDRIPTR